MARLLLSLLLFLGANNVYAYCYANSWANYGPVYSSLFVDQGTTIEQCQEIACTYYPGIPECGEPTPPAPSTCTYSAVTEQRETCGTNQVGTVTFKREQNALTRMVAPLTQDGLKSQGRAKQRQQPVNKASKKGK